MAEPVRRRDRAPAEDVVARRRAWYWRGKYRLVAFVFIVCVIVWVFQVILYGQTDFTSIPGITWDWLKKNLSGTLTPPTAIQIVILLFRTSASCSGRCC